MHIETLREFITIAQLGSYTAAAKSSTSPNRRFSTIRPEKSLTTSCSSKSSRSSSPRRAASSWTTRARRSWTETMEPLATLKDHAPELVRIQDLTFFDFMSGESRKVKETVKRRYPSVTFDVRKCKTYQSSLAALLDSDIDVGFMFNIAETPFDRPELAVHAGYCSLPLVDYAGEFRLGVPKNSPLLDKGSLTLKDFADQRFCAIASNHYESLIEDFRAHARGVPPQIEYETVQNHHDF
ncbi:MAG: LysR family transcriptional regulator substrate-binding protein [Eggerthellaceae bacterium]